MEHALTKYRKQRNLSMEAFGQRVAASKSMVSKWERGVSLPRRDAMRRISDVTDGEVTPGDFVNGYVLGQPQGAAK